MGWYEDLRRKAAEMLSTKPDKATLVTEQGGPTVTGVRSPYSGAHPAAGLDPLKLARILRSSIAGDARAYLELAEDMEERDPHYAGVLGIRKRQVASVPITVEAVSDAAEDVADADLVREVVDREMLRFELIDILDATGKGYSATEILWDTSEGQWRPSALRWRDPRHFTIDPIDGETLYLEGDAGPEVLKTYSWIVHHGKVKSGLPIRGGLARLASWSVMFKSFNSKDWAVFAEAYGQPLRVGKYPPGTSEGDKEILLQAVRNIGSDFGAIIPAGMELVFVEASVSGSLDLYERRGNWLDQQVSKGVLGQTQTTDATAGGYATAKVHDGVRGDIEEADAGLLAATLNRDLVRPLIDLNRPRRAGPRTYPKIVMRRPDEVDVEKLVKNVVSLVPFGLRVSESVMRDKLGLPDPADGEQLLVAATPAPVPAADGKPTAASALAGLFGRSGLVAGGQAAAPPRDAVDLLADATDALAGDAMDAMIGRVAMARAKVFEQHARARAMFEGLRSQIDDADVDETTRLLAEFVKDIVMTLSAEGEVGSTKNAMEIARAVKDLASAQKISADRRLAIEAATKAKLIKAVDAVEAGVAGGADKLDAAEVLRRIREDVYGIFER